MTYTRFQTPYDIEECGRFADDNPSRATIKVTFRSSIAKGLRGSGNIFVVMDEAAHFTDNGQSCAREVYEALVPSLQGFSPKDPKNPQVVMGPVESRIMMMSSPIERSGFFYETFNKGMINPDNGRLCLQIPTWDLNPTVPQSCFQDAYDRSPLIFYSEYGAEWHDPRECHFTVDGLTVEKDNVVFSVKGPDGIIVQKLPKGGWCVTTGNVA